MKLRELIAPRRKPRRRPRADAPRTIIPGTPEAKIDAARERLRREIPARADD